MNIKKLFCRLTVRMKALILLVLIFQSAWLVQASSSLNIYHIDKGKNNPELSYLAITAKEIKKKRRDFHNLSVLVLARANLICQQHGYFMAVDFKLQGLEDNQEALLIDTNEETIVLTSAKPRKKTKTLTSAKPRKKTKTLTSAKPNNKTKKLTSAKPNNKTKTLTSVKPNNKTKTLTSAKPNNKTKTLTSAKPNNKTKTLTSVGSSQRQTATSERIASQSAAPKDFFAEEIFHFELKKELQAAKSSNSSDFASILSLPKTNLYKIQHAQFLRNIGLTNILPELALSDGFYALTRARLEEANVIGLMFSLTKTESLMFDSISCLKVSNPITKEEITTFNNRNICKQHKKLEPLCKSLSHSELSCFLHSSNYTQGVSAIYIEKCKEIVAKAGNNIRKQKCLETAVLNAKIIANTLDDASELCEKINTDFWSQCTESALSAGHLLLASVKLCKPINNNLWSKCTNVALLAGRGFSSSIEACKEIDNKIWATCAEAALSADNWLGSSIKECKKVNNIFWAECAKATLLNGEKPLRAIEYCKEVDNGIWVECTRIALLNGQSSSNAIEACENITDQSLLQCIKDKMSSGSVFINSIRACEQPLE